MKVKKADGGLVVELPMNVIEDLGLKEGDEVKVRVAGLNDVEINKPMTREEALRTLEELSRPLPPGYKFNRAELHER